MTKCRIRIIEDGSYSGARPTAQVTLKQPPWGELEPSDRQETAPKGPAIRGDFDWRKDPVLRSASRVRK